MIAHYNSILLSSLTFSELELEPLAESGDFS